MEDILNKFKLDGEIEYNSNIYRTLSKTKYATKDSPGRFCYKIFLTNHREIVLLPDDNLLLFGCDIGQLDNIQLDGLPFTYNGQKYRMTIHDYQYVSEHFFGDLNDSEGEVEFWDYDAENNIDSISLGVDIKTNARCDVIAKIIHENDLKFLS